MKFLLVTLMALGSLVLWVVIPVTWLWAGSQLAAGQAASLGPYLLVLAGIPVSMFFWARFLHRLNGVYERVTGTEPTVRVQLAWLRGLRGEAEGRPPRRILDVVMVATVLVAGLVFGAWFLLFAGSSLPGA